MCLPANGELGDPDSKRWRGGRGTVAAPQQAADEFLRVEAVHALLAGEQVVSDLVGLRLGQFTMQKGVDAAHREDALILHVQGFGLLNHLGRHFRGRCPAASRSHRACPEVARVPG